MYEIIAAYLLLRHIRALPHSYLRWLCVCVCIKPYIPMPVNVCIVYMLLTRCGRCLGI